MTRSSNEPPYKPRMSREQTDRIRRWHERAYSAMKARDDAEIVYLDRRFVVPPQVFPPARMSELLGRAVLEEVQAGDRVLDMGTGCGVNAILAASRSLDVTGVDINPYAIACARDNAARNGVADRIEFLESDVFQHIQGEFDLVIFDPPFRWFAPRDHLEAAIADEHYQALTRFMFEVGRHLRDGGRILLFFGSSGDLDYLLELIDRSGFLKEVIAQQSLTQDDCTVDYFTFRLRQRH